MLSGVVCYLLVIQHLTALDWIVSAEVSALVGGALLVPDGGEKDKERARGEQFSCTVLGYVDTFFGGMVDAYNADIAHSPMMSLCIHGEVEKLRQLLTDGSAADINYVFPHTGLTVLMASLQARRPEATLLLLEKGADPKIIGKV